MSIFNASCSSVGSFYDARRRALGRTVEVEYFISKLRVIRADYKNGIFESYTAKLESVVCHDYIDEIIDAAKELSFVYLDAYNKLTEDNFVRLSIVLDLAEAQYEAAVRNLLNENH